MIEFLKFYKILNTIKKKFINFFVQIFLKKIKNYVFSVNITYYYLPKKS